MSSIVLVLVLVLGSPCPLQPPVDGVLMRPFDPRGSYGGHWGVDLAAAPGTPVLAAGRGTVTFAGSVAGRLSVTIHHGGGVRTSYSYLSSIAVSVGSIVAMGDVVGDSGMDNGLAGVHFSLRIWSIYVAPLARQCVLVPSRGLRLGGEAAAATYPRPRATRHPRRHLRPTTSGPPPRR